MSLEFNKASAAILVTAIVVMGSAMIAEHVIHPKEPAKKAYIVEGVGEEIAGGPVAAVEEVLPPITPLLASADIEKGKDVLKKCTVCHSFDKGGPNKVGPNLWNIINAQKGAVGGYAYSQALLDKGGDWNVESMNEFMVKPKKYIPGTKMAFAGLKKEKDRANLIAYLQTLK